MHKEIVAALIGGASVIIAAVIGIATLDITPATIANNKTLESKYREMSIENDEVIKKYDNLSLQYESLATENGDIQNKLSQLEDALHSSDDSDYTNQEKINSTQESTSPNNSTIGWIKDDNGWFYQNIDGTRFKGWNYIDGKWYYLNDNGYRLIGWQLLPNGKYYYFEDDGVMLANQFTPDGYWVDESGVWIPEEIKETVAVVNNPEQKTSIFTLDTFQRKGYWFDRSGIATDDEFIDTYGNEYLTAHKAYHGPATKDSNTAPIYLLDNKYKKCQGQFAWSKADKNLQGSIWIEFYSGDSLIYESPAITATDRVVSFEFSVEGVETLTIVRNGTNKHSVNAVYPYLDLIQ